MMLLIRKELWLASDVIAGACVLLVASFPLASLGILMMDVKPFPWASVVGGGCVLNQYTMVLTGALIGAVAFAREREEGNVQYLAYLPVSRSVQFASKVTGGFFLWGGLWSVNLAVLAFFTLMVGADLDSLLPFLPRMAGTAVFSFAAWGCASLAACYLASVTASAFGGLVAVAIAAALRIVLVQTVSDLAFFSPAFLLLLAVMGITVFGLSASAFCLEPRGIRRIMHGATTYSSDDMRKLNVASRGATATLFLKDVRLLAGPLTVGAVLLCLPYAAAVGSGLLVGNTAHALRTASLAAMPLGWIVLPLWSASSLAQEWTTSSHQFLAYLPVSTKRNVFAKFAVSAAPSAVVISTCLLSFLLAHLWITGVSPMELATAWDSFNESGYIPGAVAYAGALPVTFAVAWYFAARLRRKIVAIVLGVVSGPVAMATWAITAMPEGIIAERLLPFQAVGVHGTTLAMGCMLLVALGTRRILHTDSA